MIYLDNAASTPIHPEVLKTLNESLELYFANPSASHKLGKTQKKLIDKVKLNFLSLMNGSGGQLVFTSSATEANTTIIRGLDLRAGDQVFYNKADHPSLVNAIENLSEKGVVPVAIANRIDGLWDLNELSEKISEKTKLVCLAHVNNQTGISQHVERLGAILKDWKNCHFHLDGMQAVGKLDVDLSKIGSSSYSFGAHKIQGPKGIGALYLKNGVSILPLLLGGSQQEGLRSSTENTPFVLSFEKAFEIVNKNLNDVNEKMLELNKYVRETISSKNNQFEFPYSIENTVPQILMLKIEGISSDIILRHMEEEDIYLASGSACSSKIKGYNPTFEALGIDEKFHKNFLRISFGPGNDLKQIQSFCDTLVETVEDLKGFMR
ncbi:MAG: aminotransferase class V-fold PLP-dependent enzyme [Bacteriovoracaceae bacterium]|nr:aminotransferase class V-fold PLP-dependent enzyme [Bacteriovoracaceae bacterium]